MKKTLINQLPLGMNYLFKLFYPFMDLLVKFDNTKLIKNNLRLRNHLQGYFIICKKNENNFSDR